MLKYRQNSNPHPKPTPNPILNPNLKPNLTVSLTLTMTHVQTAKNYLAIVCKHCCTKTAHLQAEHKYTTKANLCICVRM